MYVRSERRCVALTAIRTRQVGLGVAQLQAGQYKAACSTFAGAIIVMFGKAWTEVTDYNAMPVLEKLLSAFRAAGFFDKASVVLALATCWACLLTLSTPTLDAVLMFSLGYACWLVSKPKRSTVRWSQASGSATTPPLKLCIPRCTTSCWHGKRCLPSAWGGSWMVWS